MFLTQSFVANLQGVPFDDFKKLVIENFGAVFDTKQIFTSVLPTVKETSLGNMPILVLMDTNYDQNRKSVQICYGRRA